MGVAGSWLPARRTPDPRGLTASERRGGTFAYYLPARLAGQDVASLLERDVREEALETAAHIATTSALVDERTRTGIYQLLLRSESIASSMIERISAQPRDVAFAQLGDAPSHLTQHDATSIARNVQATRLAVESLARRERWRIEDVEEVHAALGFIGVRTGLREVDVWIGGRDPVRAQYVAPPAAAVPDLVEDLLRYIATSGEHPLILAAVAHLQFESIHPLEDGNGRVGRALVHAVLERGGVVRSGLLPISTVIRRREKECVDLLDGSRSDDPARAAVALNDWLRFFVSVAQESVEHVRRVQASVQRLDDELAAKAAGLRSDASARRILPLLLEQPVVTARFVAESLQVSTVAAHRAVDTLVARGILTPGTGKYRRSEVYRAPDVLQVLDEGLSPEG